MEELLQTAYQVLKDYECYNPIFSFTCYGTETSIKPYMHQIEFVARNLLRKPLRILLSDEIGLGKTVTALVTLRRLQRLGLARRVLIAVPRILVTQWESELRRIGIRFQRITRTIFKQLVYEGFPEGVYLTSMDLIKRERYIERLRHVPWDVIIVDEAHRLGKKRGKETQRYSQIGRKLIEAYPERNVLLLSATPHRGDPYDYISRLLLLDPYLERGKHLDNVHFYASTHNVLVFRRRKTDVNEVYERRRIFTDCRLKAVVVAPTLEEEEFHKRLIIFLSTKLRDFYERTGREPKALGLLLSLIFKRASSSPPAAIKTMLRIIERREEILEAVEGRTVPTDEDERYAEVLADSLFGFGFEDYEEYFEDYEGRDEIVDPDEALNKFAEKCSFLLSDEDIEELKQLIRLAEAIKRRDSRLLALKELIRHHLREGRKVIVFTEYKDTADYIKEALEKELGKGKVARLTGEEASNEQMLRRVRRRFERGKTCRILVATDVASEGLNLQVANIIFNYEPPWSPIKLEQRIGRVWRLGQESDVIAYTIFLGVESDRDVLNILYRKLIALGRSIGAEKPPIGEEAIVIDMQQREDIPVQLSEFRKDGRKIRTSEYTFRIQYIKGGRAALNDLVEYIIQSIQRLKEDLRRLNVLPKVERESIERLLTRSCGFATTEEAENALERLLKALSKVKGSRFKISHAEDGQITVITPGGTPIEISDLNTALAVTKAVIEDLTSQRAIRSEPVNIITYSDEDYEIYLYELTIEERYDSNCVTLYREPIGIRISKDGVKIIRGPQLLEALARAINDYMTTCSEYQTEDQYVLLRLKSKVRDLGNIVFSTLMDELERYRTRLERRGWRGEDPWFPRAERSNIRVDGPIAIITSTSERAHLKELELDPLLKRRVENKAMEYAMKYEKENGREPLDVSQQEHYDILSRDPKSGETRYIEVKGHLGSSLIAELTEPEFKFAEEKGKEYWLYIVNNIGSGKPRLRAIRNPLEEMEIEVVETKKYRLVPKQI